MHDLGKNILSMVLQGKGYRVVDCGKDCPIDDMIDAAERDSAIAIGVSGLLTTVVWVVREVREKARARGLSHVKIMAGGAALRQSNAEKLNVDYVGETAFDGARYLDSLLEGDT